MTAYDQQLLYDQEARRPRHWVEVETECQRLARFQEWYTRIVLGIAFLLVGAGCFGLGYWVATR